MAKRLRHFAIHRTHRRLRNMQIILLKLANLINFIPRTAGVLRVC